MEKQIVLWCIMSKILVIGDSCRDVFVYCESDRLCPDVPVPVLNIIDQKDNPGMAKNVQRNIKSLGAMCEIKTNSNWFDYTKTRYMHAKSNHMFLRVDSNSIIKRADIKDIDYRYDIIVISDYDKGYLFEEDIEQICNNHPLVFLDTKKVIGRWCRKAAFIKINNYEYSRSKSSIDDCMQEKIIITKGSDGCVYNGKHYEVDRVDVMDVSGAGDTFMACLVCEYVKSKDIASSIRLANKGASEAVRHRGVTCIGDLIKL